VGNVVTAGLAPGLFRGLVSGSGQSRPGTINALTTISGPSTTPVAASSRAATSASDKEMGSAAATQGFDLHGPSRRQATAPEEAVSHTVQAPIEIWMGRGLDLPESSLSSQGFDTVSLDSAVPDPSSFEGSSSGNTPHADHLTIAQDDMANFSVSRAPPSVDYLAAGSGLNKRFSNFMPPATAAGGGGGGSSQFQNPLIPAQVFTVCLLACLFVFIFHIMLMATRMISWFDSCIAAGIFRCWCPYQCRGVMGDHHALRIQPVMREYLKHQCCQKKEFGAVVSWKVEFVVEVWLRFQAKHTTMEEEEEHRWHWVQASLSTWEVDNWLVLKWKASLLQEQQQIAICYVQISQAQIGMGLLALMLANFWQPVSISTDRAAADCPRKSEGTTHNSKWWSEGPEPKMGTLVGGGYWPTTMTTDTK
jgi:hypothetical protein